MARGTKWTRRKRFALALMLGLGLAALGLGAALLTIDRWFFALIDPGPFDAAVAPPAPNYANAEAWAALPELEDGADVSLPELPAIDQMTAPVDVFYIHPTTAVGSDWNAAFDDPTVVEATLRGGTSIQASVFNACCAVHAPRYRQAHGRAFVHPDRDGDRAIDIAYGDISRAFDQFSSRIGDRPFIVAAHSQGTILAARLIRERVAGRELQRRLVVAYLVGGPIRLDTIGAIPVCETPTQTGCVAAWNARGPDYEPNGFEFDADEPATMNDRICVNPIHWTHTSGHALAADNAGALFFDTEAPFVKPGFADANCVDGTLIVTSVGDLERDFMSELLLWMMGPGNYHPVEYQLFYVDLRRNVAARVEAFSG